MKILKLVFSRFLLWLAPHFLFHRLVIFAFRIRGFRIQSNCRIFSTVQIIGDVKIEICSNTFIGHEVLLMGGKNSCIYIGNECDISTRVTMITGTHKIDSLNLRSAGEGYSASIYIGDGVWIGFGAKILPGVRIGDKAIIGAGSLINKDVPPRAIVAGNPAKIIRYI